MFSALIATFSIALGTSTNTAKAEPQDQSTAPAKSPVLKVGETRSQWMARSQDNAIAKIFEHKVSNRAAATVYVRNIPVLTFLESQTIAKPIDKLKSERVGSDISSSDVKAFNSGVSPNTNAASKASSVKLPSSSPVQSNQFSLSSANPPLERATAAAALINQLSLDSFDASNIVPVWESNKYLIKLGSIAKLEFDRSSLVLPSSTNDPAADVLEAANLLRRLMGGVSPLQGVVNAPAQVKPVIKIVRQATQILSGLASWYGPELHGNRSASGEPFNQNDLTAAHRSLPFGTSVRVTNVQTGKSVIVRINDRGPFEHSRVIDLSTAAARVIGLISSGIAPVKLEVMSRAR